MVKRRFSSRRGRPALQRPQQDSGTPELQAKRAAGITSEGIDLALQHALINQGEHWTALHFRWLYSLRFGSPRIQALDIACPGRGIAPPARKDDVWHLARNQEYREAAQLLEAHGLLVAVLRVAVFDDTTPLLSKSHAAQKTLQQLQEGVALLHRHWRSAEPQRPIPQRPSVQRQRFH